MKKVLGLAAIIFFMMAGCFSSFAQKVKEEYEIYYVDFWIDDGNGTAMAEWSRTEGSTSYQVQLMKASSQKGHETAVVDKKLNHSTTELDVTNAIAQNGTG